VKRRGRRGQARQSRQSFLTRERRLKGGNGVMLDFGIEKLFRDAAIFLHMDATADISRFKIVKALFPHSAGIYAGPEP
jgi:alkylation response protein AidB-like acyl-CoA dehydrogenase